MNRYRSTTLDGSTGRRVNGPAIRHAHALDAVRDARCPVCDSSDVVGGTLTLDVGCSTQRCQCGACGARWSESYTLDTVSDVETGDGEPVAVYP